MQALLGSYWGHFAHADSVRLRHTQPVRPHAVAAGVFTLQADASLSVNMPARWQVLRLRAMRRFLNPQGK